MGLEFFGMIMQLIAALGITLGLMFLLYKLLGKKAETINNGKYVRIIEKTQLSKDTSILVVKVGKKGYVIVNSTNAIKKLSQLTENELIEIEESKKKLNEQMINQYTNMIYHLKAKYIKKVNNIRSKEENNEK